MQKINSRPMLSWLMNSFRSLCRSQAQPPEAENPYEMYCVGFLKKISSDQILSARSPERRHPVPLTP